MFAHLYLAGTKPMLCVDTCCRGDRYMALLCLSPMT